MKPGRDGGTDSLEVSGEHGEAAGRQTTRTGVRSFTGSSWQDHPRKGVSPSLVTRHSEIACHAAAISWKLGRKLNFDPAKENFIDAPDADALCSRPRRAPFTV